MLATHLCPMGSSAPSFIETIKPWAEAIEHVVVTIASLVAGGWALLRLRRERGFDSALTIDLHAVPVQALHHSYMSFDVTLANVGKVAINAKPVPKGTDAYSDSAQPDSGDLIVSEKLRYSGSLIVRRVVHAVSDSPLDWFNRSHFEPDSEQEVDLLTEYLDPDTSTPDFWMEPGESYHLGVAMRLSPGVYLAKVTFVGRSIGEFWSRITTVTVPRKNESSRPESAG